ncbi:MAG: FHA domain-containing protein [Cyanobacteriota bacterium]|nr:FHA domain-containing protein [Cyanobacteriota bacterium]
MVRASSQAGQSKMRNVLVVKENNGGLRAVSLEAATYSLGRDPTNSILLEAERISRHHAILMRVPEGKGYVYRIMDGNLVGEPSRNGITVNGEKVTSHDLQDGDTIIFGGAIKAQYYHREMSDEDFSKYIQSVALRSIRSEPVDTMSTIVDF